MIGQKNSTNSNSKHLKAVYNVKFRNFELSVKLEVYIADLLKQHNCVIVPDFGGFVANYKSAVVDEFRKQIHPPSKTVLFNPQLTNNDGLLGNYVSQHQAIQYPEALSFVSKEVARWSTLFENNERIEIGEIGVLYKERDKVHFEQSRDVNLLLQAYGLRSIDFVDFGAAKAVTKPVVEKTIPVEEKPVEVREAKPVTKKEKVLPIVKKIISVEEITEEPVIKDEPKVTEEEETPVIALNTTQEIESTATVQSQEGDSSVPKRRVGLTILKYTAAAAIVPVLFYSYWIPMETDAVETKSIQLSDFNPIHQQVDKSYQGRKTQVEFEEIDTPTAWEELTVNINADIYNFELAEDFYVPILLSNNMEEPVVMDINVSKETDVNEVVQVTGDFHVISGCFSIRSNAEAQVRDLNSKGFQASILDQSGGLHRVTAGGYDTKDAAKSGLEKVRNSGESGWILKK